MSASGIPFLTRELRSFVQRLDETRRAIEARVAAGGSPGLGELPGDPVALRDRLAATLKAQLADAQREGYNAKSDTFQQAQAVQARLADVTLGGIAWWGRDATRLLAADFPLPDGVAAGVREQIDDLLSKEPPDFDLAEVYLLALAAGLEPAPRLPDAERQAELARCQRQLYDRVLRHRPELASPPPPRLFPAAYARGQARDGSTFLPRVSFWLTALAVALAAFVLASFPVFHQATRDLGRTLDQVLQSPLQPTSTGP